MITVSWVFRNRVNQHEPVLSVSFQKMCWSIVPIDYLASRKVVR